MSKSQGIEPMQVPNIEITENLSSSSHLSSSVEHLVEVTRRLTVCNQLQSALENRSETCEYPRDECESRSTSDVPSELADEEEIQPITDASRNPKSSSTFNLSGSDCTAHQSPQSNTKKWARLLGISPEDIGDEEEFIVSCLNEYFIYLFTSHIFILNAIKYLPDIKAMNRLFLPREIHAERKIS